MLRWRNLRFRPTEFEDMQARQALMTMSRSDMDRANLPIKGQHRLADAQGVWQLLVGANMEDYLVMFLKDGYDTVEDVEQMDADALKTCGVKPGHIKRFLRHQSGQPSSTVPPRGGLCDR